MFNARLPYILAATTCLIVALMSYRFVFMDLKLSFPEMAGQIDHNRVAFMAHVSFAPVALILGAYQMFWRQTGRRGRLHVWVGRGYALAIVISGIAGVLVALVVAGGWIASLGFGLLSVLWVLATLIAVWQAIQGRIAAHRRWMIYSFAMTFAGVTLRVYLAGFAIAGFSYTEASLYLAWMCWVPNLIVAHWFLRRKRAA